MESILELFDKIIELHGDRTTAEDATIESGFAWIGGRRCGFLAAQERDVSASGLRKCLRVIELAEHLDVPLVLVGDFALSDPANAAQQSAILTVRAQLLDALIGSRVPLIAVVGEELSPSSRRWRLIDIVVAAGARERTPRMIPYAPGGAKKALAEAVKDAATLDRDGLEAARAERLETLMNGA